MATEKVGIYRKYHGPVPTDSEGRPLPKAEWPRKRACRWCVRWFGTDGQRYSKSFDNLKEAERFKENQQSEVRKGKADLPRAISLKDYAAEHLTMIQGQVTFKTRQDHQRALDYLKDIVSDIPLQKISPRHAELYVRRRIEAKVSACTINKEIACLRRIFNLAIERRGYLPEGQNPFKKVEKRKVSANPVRYVTAAEFKRLIEVCRNLRWKILLSLLYTTGLRIDEARHLTWSDIDFERGLLHVAAKRDPRRLVPWEPKDHELRHIPLGQEMMDLLARWQSLVPEGVPYLFLTKERYQWVMAPLYQGKWSEARDLVNNLQRGFKLICKRAGVTDCNFHDLRRSCITNWARHLPAHVVRKLAGHSSLETTMKYYLSVQEDDLAKAKDLSDALLSRTMPKKKQQELDHDLTDPKLTHSGQNGVKAGSDKKDISAQDIEN